MSILRAENSGDFVMESRYSSLPYMSRARAMPTDADVQWTGDSSSDFCGGLRMRSNIMYSFAAVFATFVQFMAVYATFALPSASIAGQPAGAMPAQSITQEQRIAEVIVEGRHAI
jgi:hypothetical protein